MAASIVQLTSGSQNTATASQSIGLTSSVIAGNYIVIIYSGDSYVSTAPAGFQLPAGAAQEQYMGHYAWYKVATGGEKNFTISLNTSATFAWTVMEISGLSDFEGAAGVSNTAVSSSYATPNITPTTGAAFMIATIAGSLDTAAMTTLSGWTNAYIEQADVHTTLSSGTRDSLGVATKAYTADGSTSTSTTATWDNSPSVQSHSGIILAFNAGPPDTAPPSSPSNVVVTGRSSSSVDLRWTASTDNVQVKGYNIYVNGSSSTTTSTANNVTVTGLSALTSYTFMVKAFDKAGNNSTASPAVSMTTLEGVGRYVWYGAARHLVGPRIIGVPSGLAGLARIPWEGGPAYYGNFSQATASGMTSNSFFPLLVDFESVLSQTDVNADKAYGVNGYYRLTSDTSLSLIRSNNMIAFPGVDITDTKGNETVGYNVDDEVDMWAGPGWSTWNGHYPGDSTAPNANSGYDVMYQLTHALPTDGRMRHMNYGKGVVMWENTTDSTVFTNGGTNAGHTFALDAMSADLYFYSDQNVGTEAQTYFGLAAGSVRRAANYGNLVVKRILDQQHNGSIYHPVYGFVETASQSPTIPQASLTDNMIEGAVWSCICHEARGIIYFVHDFVYSGSSHCLRENVGGHTPRVTSLNARITTLAPILNTQSYVWQFNSSIKTMFKVSGGYAYIFAMSQLQDAHDTSPRLFVLPQAITGKTVTVDGESRTIAVTGGSFKDTFAAEYTFHLYKIAL